MQESTNDRFLTFWIQILLKVSKIILYADGISLYKPITSHDDAIAFQSDINMVTNWFSDCGLKLNLPKTKLMILSYKHFPPKSSVYIDATPINQVESLSTLESISLLIFLGLPTSTPLAPELESSLASYTETSTKKITIVLPTYIKPQSYHSWTVVFGTHTRQSTLLNTKGTKVCCLVVCGYTDR